LTIKELFIEIAEELAKKFDSIVPREQRSKVIAKLTEEVKRHEDKVTCLLGSKAEIPHKKRSGRRFVSVRKWA
jgi:metal-responsive CopG/Arc/MetJ family transcriptional regulator